MTVPTPWGPLFFNLNFKFEASLKFPYEVSWRQAGCRPCRVPAARTAPCRSVWRGARARIFSRRRLHR